MIRRTTDLDMLGVPECFGMIIRTMNKTRMGRGAESVGQIDNPVGTSSVQQLR